MKHFIKITTLFIFIFFGINTLKAQSKKISFIVSGKCEMCKERIENALEIKGIKFANWDEETKICKVTYKPEIITEDNIQRTLAEAGHDTPLYKAEEEKYNDLHKCCKYPRMIPKK